ncbi:flagellar basal-body rod protein FlgF [Anaeroselena agilis]|uniref:Flagellar basal-body rod protein FlgF n=1 Tax=Anaeroselena agilis TaxID=3063788 RepID=A0ABU3P4Z9_9FIRM|nr:flagellar basal-body rod protein FlgF [Selenomonadales bacterium 4137-cl]
MIRGIYVAGSGMMTEATRTDVIANNLANASTAGYRKDVAIGKDFRSMLIRRINDGPNSPLIGSMGVGSVIDEVATIHEQGGIRPTGNKFDLAIEGRGFFAVETPAGVRYTRNGGFTRSAQGELVTVDGYRVLGQGGAIQLGDPESQVYIADDGRVMVDDAEADTLRIADFADVKRLVKEGANLFAAAPGQQEEPVAGITVRAGYLEHSNVNVVAEMVNLIAGYRAYEINGKAVQAHDSLLDKAVNDVGRV